MDRRVQLIENAVKGIVLAWHCRCTWNFLHRLIQSTVAVLVPVSRICPLVRLLSHLNNVKRTGWEVCVTAIANESKTPPSTSSPFEALNHSLRAQKNELFHKHELKGTSPTPLAKRTSPPIPSPPLKQTLYSVR